jgi:hypothetical protein
MFYIKYNNIIFFILNYKNFFISDLNLFYGIFYNELKERYEHKLNYLYTLYKWLGYFNFTYNYSYDYSSLKLSLQYLINNYNDFFIE